MFKKAFGVLSILLGIFLAGAMLYFKFTGKAPQLDGLNIIRALIMPVILVAFGITWVSGGTFRGLGR